MADRSRFKSLPAGNAVADRETGLVWDALPRPELLAWREAVASLNAGRWRLPTASELMTLLTTPSFELPRAAIAPGVSFWSASESPFAPPDQVRVILCDGTGCWTVTLRSKTEVARLWRVRALEPAELAEVG